jgi:hypothetical protein
MNAAAIALVVFPARHLTPGAPARGRVQALAALHPISARTRDVPQALLLDFKSHTRQAVLEVSPFRCVENAEHSVANLSAIEWADASDLHLTRVFFISKRNRDIDTSADGISLGGDRCEPRKAHIMDGAAAFVFKSRDQTGTIGRYAVFLASLYKNFVANGFQGEHKGRPVA